MPLRRLDTIRKKLIHKNPYWEYWLDSYTLPDGNVGEYNYVHTPGSVMVVPADNDGKLILVKQFRYLWKREGMEFPSGGMKGDDPLVAAKNELAEEANVAASNWRFVGEYNPFNGITDEIARVYFASGLHEAEKEKDASEEFEIVRMTVSEFQTAINSGQIWDGMTLAAWILARPTVLDYIAAMNSTG